MNTDIPSNQLELPMPQEVETHRERLIRLAVALQRLGVSGQQVEELLSGYSLDLVEQQLIWFPTRKARKKASLIVSAIRQNYEKPANYLE